MVPRPTLRIQTVVHARTTIHRVAVSHPPPAGADPPTATSTARPTPPSRHAHCLQGHRALPLPGRVSSARLCSRRAFHVGAARTRVATHIEGRILARDRLLCQSMQSKGLAQLDQDEYWALCAC